MEISSPSKSPKDNGNNGEVNATSCQDDSFEMNDEEENNDYFEDEEDSDNNDSEKSAEDLLLALGNYWVYHIFYYSCF